MGEGREYTLKIDNVDWKSITGNDTALEDRTDYILEEDREAINKYIEELQQNIRTLKSHIAYLSGLNEAWEKMWRIWNGEE